ANAIQDWTHIPPPALSGSGSSGWRRPCEPGASQPRGHPVEAFDYRRWIGALPAGVMTEPAVNNPLTGKPLGPHWRPLTRMVRPTGIPRVPDTGANIGQYAAALRARGHAGRIVSVEPLGAAHADLAPAAARDGNWVAAPRAAVGAAA